jgi:hypothetical protein
VILATILSAKNVRWKLLRDFQSESDLGYLTYTARFLLGPNGKPHAFRARGMMVWGRSGQKKRFLCFAALGRQAPGFGSGRAAFVR